MATQLFLLNTLPDAHLGTDNVNLRGTAVGWTSRALGTARGSGVVASAATATVAGATPGIEIALTGPVVCEWISQPVAADVTISGTITANLWAAESANNANTAINVVIEIIRANATATRNSNTLLEIVRSTRVTELGTSRAAINFTTGMTSGGYTGQTLNRGDRLRIRVFGDDSSTMGSGFTFNFGYNGATAAADGDSYVTLSETVTFENAPGAVVLDQTDTTTPINIGNTTNRQQVAQPFVAQGDLTEVRAWLSKTGTPTDNMVVEVQTDSSGAPSGSVVGTVATVAATSVTSFAQFTWSCSITLTSSTTYWLVFRRSGTLSDTNVLNAFRTTGSVSGWSALAQYNGAAWSSTGTVAAVRLQFSSPVSTLYLTDTASAVSTASVDREAWTSRGAGVQTDVTNTAAGWTAPLQLTDTAGGTVVDWFTRPLTAFTLTGMAAVNLRALESNAAANASLRCEIARVEGDGTSPTVWASWCVAPLTTDNGELGTTEAARTANVSGDDLAITNGQRLRIRVYADDMSSAAMATANTVTLYYAGTSGGASGDTYLTLPVIVTEYSAGTPGPASTRRYQRASRFLTSR